MYKVIKRDGTVVGYDIKKIREAIIKAFEACKRKYNDDTIDFLALKVTADFEPKVKHNKITVENIQDSVEAVLIKADYDDVAKAYILYRKQREKIRNSGKTLIDYKDVVDKYLKVEDWRVKENSTVTYSVGGLILSNSGAVTANYWLSEVYDEEIANAHRNADIHIHDLSMLTGYCAGWSLKQLIQEGLGGVKGKITSSPASHLSTLCNQMVNFLGIMQNEWAGAQAFSSFDTYLAPFIKKDNLTYKEVKQCIQSFVYGVNTPSRWGCVTSDTEVLSVDGFKKYNELKKGDLIYTWNNGKLELNPVREVVIKPHKGIMHAYIANGYNQTITPTHRMLIKKHNKDEYIITHSENIFDAKTPYALPVAFKTNSLPASKLSDAEIKLAAAVYTDGSIDIRNNSVHKITIFKSPKREGHDLIEECSKALGLEYSLIPKKNGFDSDFVNQYIFYGKNARFIYNLITNKQRIDQKFLTMNAEQSLLFLKTWAIFDGSKEKFKLQYDNNIIAEQLQHIALRAGLCSYIKKSKNTNYVKIRQTNNIYPASRQTIEYDDIVWCPNVENGTAVFRKDGTVYISGQTQAPFTNITLDWTVPADLAELNCIVGGKEMDFQYKDCQKEMDMVNKAFIEIMIEGDANGRGFQYPIPTYSITRDFDWSDTENNRLLFEMTAKYGTPYFSNYINSDMEPSDVRSMCPLYGKQKVLVMNDYSNEYHVSTIENLYKGHKANKEYTILCNGKPKKALLHCFNNLDFYKIHLANGQSVIFSGNHQNLTLDGIKQSCNLSIDDYLPFETIETPGEGLSYIDGLFVGAFLGDGSLKDDYTIVLSLNNTTKKDFAEQLKQYAIKYYGARINENIVKDSPCVNISFTSKMLRGLVEDYVIGKGINKELLTKYINRSVDFRKGIIDGLLETDGNKDSKRVYSSSIKGAESIVTLFASLGIPTSITTDTRGSSETLSDNPVYSIRPYNVKNGQVKYKDVYIKKDKYMWFKIDSIEKLNTTSKIGYCFEVLNDDKPYFMMPNGLITHNCRLRLDLRELRKKSGGFFGSGESTGSVGVVTINMPRIAYLSKNEEDFFNRLDKIMDISARSLKIKRDVITQLLNNGLYPYTKRYLGTFNNHFSTIGLVGMNEAGLNAKWLQKDMTNEETQLFTAKVLNHMRERLSDYQEKYGDLYNLEATPAESTSFRLAKHDKQKYPNIITAAKNENDTPYYTNSSHLPVGYTEDIFTALDVQDELQTLYTSGTVFHAFLGEKLPDWKAAATLVRKIAENYKLPYYTMSPTYSVCKNHGYISGEVYICPECGEHTEVYSRITGYYRPVQNWNDGKTQEFKDRQEYIINELFDDTCETCKISDDSFKPTETLSKDNIDNIISLVTTPTCPNCKFVKSKLDKKGIKYQVINALENKDFCQKYNIKQAPTMLVQNESNKTIVYSGVSNILKYFS